MALKSRHEKMAQVRNLEAKSKEDVFRDFKNTLTDFWASIVSKIWLFVLGWCIGTGQWLAAGIWTIVFILVYVLVVVFVFDARWFRRKVYELAWKRYLKSQLNAHKSDMDAGNG
jgi:O-antigen/teichoic acid export membrane protein